MKQDEIRDWEKSIKSLKTCERGRVHLNVYKSGKIQKGYGSHKIEEMVSVLTEIVNQALATQRKQLVEEIEELKTENTRVAGFVSIGASDKTLKKISDIDFGFQKACDFIINSLESENKDA